MASGKAPGPASGTTIAEPLTGADLLIDGPERARITIALAHGAGAPMDSPFMDAFAAALAEKGHRVARFEFPYMAARRRDGRRRPPNRAEQLQETWRQVVGLLGASDLVVGGKSMGGRMASLIADACRVRGLVCLGYPFHPPGRPDRLRTEHLIDLKTPALIVQGTRDSFGTAEEVPGYGLAKTIALHWAPDGNHDLAPRKSSGRTTEANWDEAVAAIDGFVRAL